MPRRKSASGGMNLDSLMDTLTNVVGILLIILIFALISGQEVVKRVRGFVDEVSDQQLAAAAAELESLRQLVESQRQRWETLEARRPQDELTLERQRQLLAQLQADLEKLAAAQIDPDLLRQQLEERRRKVQEIEAAIREREELLASLKARLAETPAQGPAETQVVNLPDPRPAPSGAQPVTFLCRHGRIVPLDTPTLQQEAQTVLRSAQRLIDRKEGLDCERLKELFEKRFVGDRYVRLKVRIGGDGKPYLLVEHREEAGEETANISKRTSLFNRALANLNPQKHYLEFRVWSDSFETYLAARNEAARHGLTAGWTPYPDNGDYWIGFGIDFATLCQGATPPKPAPPPDPNRPPPPPDVVD